MASLDFLVCFCHNILHFFLGYARHEWCEKGLSYTISLYYGESDYHRFYLSHLRLPFGDSPMVEYFATSCAHFGSAIPIANTLFPIDNVFSTYIFTSHGGKDSSISKEIRVSLSTHQFSSSGICRMLKYWSWLRHFYIHIVLILLINGWL